MVGQSRAINLAGADRVDDVLLLFHRKLLALRGDYKHPSYPMLCRGTDYSFLYRPDIYIYLAHSKSECGLFNFLSADRFCFPKRRLHCLNAALLHVLEDVLILLLEGGRRREGPREGQKIILLIEAPRRQAGGLERQRICQVFEQSLCGLNGIEPGDDEPADPHHPVSN